MRNLLLNTVILGFTLSLFGCYTVPNRIIGYDNINEIQTKYTKSKIRGLEYYEASKLFQLSLKHQRLDVVEHLLKNDIGYVFDNAWDDTSEFLFSGNRGSNLSQIACSAVLPGATELVQKYRPNEVIDYDLCLHETINKFSFFIDDKLLEMTAEQGQGFIDLHYQEDLRLDEIDPPRYWNDNVKSTFASLPRVYLTQENKEQYLISILEDILEHKPSLNAYIYNEQPVHLDFSVNTLTPGMQRLLLEAGYDPNYQIKCFDTIEQSDDFYVKDEFQGEIRKHTHPYASFYESGCSLMTFLLAPMRADVDFRKQQNDVDLDKTILFLQLLKEYKFDVNKPLTHLVKTEVKTVNNSKVFRKFELADMTPLQLASLYGSENLYAALLQVGADPTIINSHGLIASDYANHYEKILKSTLNQFERINAKKQPSSSSRSNDSDWLSKSLAIGIGAVAIGSLDVSSDIAMESFSALALDIATDSGGSNVNALHNKASAQQANNKPLNSFEKLNQQNANMLNQNSLNKTQQKKPIDCGYEYIKARSYVRNYGGVTNNCKIGPDSASCNSKHQRNVSGLINTELVRRGLPQCQASSSPMKKAERVHNTKGNQIEQ